MTLLVLAYLGGVLTILSPCVLPVLPFVFARAGRPFASSVLPMLLGMALTFAAVATLAAVGGGWVVQANQYGRIAAMVLLGVFGLLLLWPQLAEYFTRPLVALGNRLSASPGPDGGGGSVAGSVVLGVAVGFLWAPCAGPILGLILTGAALQGPNAQTSFLLLMYAAGAATSLALALLVGGRVFQFLKQSLGAGEWVRRGLGVAVLAAVVAIALGLDTGLLTRVSLASTSSIEQALVDKAGPAMGHPGMAGGAMMSGGGAMQGGDAMTGGAMKGGDAMTGGGAMMSAHNSGGLPIEGEMPPLAGAVSWLNSSPLTPESLRGKVVLVDFWTYSCINCLRTLPYVRAWANKYKDHGLVVIGVHTPEFAFEKNLDNVRRAVKDLQITYPVAVDNNYALWGAFYNNYWPADYFVDAQGQIRAHEFGEGDYDKSERWIQQLLAEANAKPMPASAVNVHAQGVQAASDMSDVRSPETYIGYARAQNFSSPGGFRRDSEKSYTEPKNLSLNDWGLVGSWIDHEQAAILTSSGGKIVFRFHARDLHLVLGPSADGKPVRFRVTIDGQAPGENHGVDTDAQGNGVVNSYRLYQLVRQKGAIADHTFTIEFLDPGVQAFSFTFG